MVPGIGPGLIQLETLAENVENRAAKRNIVNQIVLAGAGDLIDDFRYAVFDFIDTRLTQQLVNVFAYRDLLCKLLLLEARLNFFVRWVVRHVAQVELLKDRFVPWRILIHVCLNPLLLALLSGGNVLTHRLAGDQSGSLLDLVLTDS